MINRFKGLMILKKAEKLNTLSEDAVVINQKYGKEA